MKYKVIDTILEAKIINSIEELDECSMPLSNNYNNEFYDESIYNEKFFMTHSLLSIPYAGSQSLLGYNLFKDIIIDENEDSIIVTFKYNDIPVLLDYRKFTILIPYKKTHKKLIYKY